MAIFKRTLSAAVAVMTAAACMPAVVPVSAAQSSEDFALTVEAENMKGASCWTQNYGPAPSSYSGEGFFYLTNETATLTVNVPEDGMYNITVKAIQVLNEDGREQTVSVNGNEKMLKMPYTAEWVDFNFGDFRMNKGENTVSFPSKYGYMALDTVTITKTPPHDYSIATDVCTDPDATPEAQSLMKYLKSVYGSHIISGQQEIYGGGHSGNYEWENEFLKDLTGKYPAIRGVDFMNYNPLYGWDDGTTERCIAWAKERNGIITASWHINVPIDFENYTLGDEVDWKQCTYKNYQASNSTFNTANVLKEGTKEREYFEAAMEDLAEQLLKLQEAGVPVIWRPLHEAQGNEGNYADGTSWFWWGDRGAEVYKELWKLLYNTLTKKYGLHNLIWEFNSYDYSNSQTWYPGDDYVDIVAYDKYNVEYNRGDGKSSGPNLLAIAGKFNYLYNLTGGKKMVAMAENDTVPALDNLIVEDAGWLYFCPWYDGGEDGGTAFLGTNYQDHDELTKIYQSDYCITLDELPEDLYSNGGVIVKPTGSTEETSSDKDVLYGDANCDKEVNMADAVLIMQFLANPDVYGKGKPDGISAEGLRNADCYDPGSDVTNSDAVTIQEYKLGLTESLPVILKDKAGS